MQSKFRDGFTLLEVIASVLTLGVVVAAALGAVAAELRHVRYSAAAVQAAALAEDLLFRAQFLRWDSLTSLSDSTDGRFPAPLAQYAWRLRVQPVNERDLLEATANVIWPGGTFVAVTRFLAPPVARDTTRRQP